MFTSEKHKAGYEAMKEGRLEEAIELLNEALKHSEHPDIYSDRGVTYLHLERKTECLSDFNKAVELQPQYAFRFAARAFAKNHFGDIDGAVEDYEIAVKIDPNDAVALNNLGLLLEKKGYKDKAELRYQQADKLSKMEDHLLKVVDDLENKDAEGSNKPNKTTEPTSSEREMIDPEIKRDKTVSIVNEFKKVFTSKKQFREFVQFVKNGFKIK